MIKNIFRNLYVVFFLAGGILIPSLTIAAGEVMPNIPTEEQLNEITEPSLEDEFEFEEEFEEEDVVSWSPFNTELTPIAQEAQKKALDLLDTKGIGDVTKERFDEQLKKANSLKVEADNISAITDESLKTKQDLYREAIRTYNAISRDLTTLAQHRRIPPVRSGGILPGPGRDYSGGDYIKKKFIPKFINATITLLFSVSIVILIISGVMYMIGSGDQDAIKKAKDMSMWAIAGTVLAIFSFAIVKFIIGINFGG